jgi:hypothetical protein
VESCFVVDYSSQKDITLILIVIQKALVDIQMLAFVLFCEPFWNPCCTGFMKAQSFVDDFIGGTMTNLHMICHGT